MLSFEGKRVIVTGAGRGLGRAYALLLAERGAHVVVNDVGGSIEGDGTGSGPADDVVAEIRAAGGVAEPNIDTVATEAGAQSIVATAVDRFGGVDIVINNAGVLTSHNFPVDGLDDLDRHLSVNLTGSFAVTRAAWPHMATQGYGRVVLTSSCGILGSTIRATYGSAKAGLIGLARNLAMSGEEHGIRVNVVAPYAKTRMANPTILVGRLVEDSGQQESELFDLLRPELVAPVVAALVHDSCPVTGEIYAAGGGRVAKMFIAETPGIVSADLTPEQVANSWEAIRTEDGYTVPRSLADYSENFMKHVLDTVG